MRSRSLNSQTKDSRICKIGIYGMNMVNKGVLMSDLVSSMRDGRNMSMSVSRVRASNKSSSYLKSSLVFMSPRSTLKCNWDWGIWCFSPISCLSSNIFWALSLILFFWNWKEFMKSIFNKWYKFIMIVDSIRND